MRVIGDVAGNTTGTIFYKSVQILAQTDDIDFIGRTQSTMTEALTGSEKVVQRMNLHITQEKIQYIPVTKKSHASYPSYLEAGRTNIKLSTVCYLGSDVNCIIMMLM